MREAGPERPLASPQPLLTVSRPATARLRLLLDESRGAQPLPADQWAKGHVVTSAMWRAVDEFLEAAIVRGEE